MPLHDWSNLSGWEGVHILWMTELFHAVRPRLPEGYRAYLGSVPLLAVGAPEGKPDIRVHSWRGEEGRPERVSDAAADGDAPDSEVEIAVATIDPGTALLIEKHGALVAAVELVSPRNKDRPSAREIYTNRYLGYMLNGANLVLIDVHPRPVGFSFADRIAEELSMEQPSYPAPVAVAYRVGEPAATGGRFLAIWRRPLEIGKAMPSIPLPLTVHLSVTLDLEQTYAKAAEDAYIP